MINDADAEADADAAVVALLGVPCCSRSVSYLYCACGRSMQS